ncbi:PAS domain S-box protein [Methylobacter psychrophilus]|uniref:PAS domain S-box protein n=1 Tax=Methylobacter psychrophilus TaxID=96941 RepID=UPI0021D49B83|nr:PAS domain S-box protein [Methylobacter psychrophilus]
MKSHISKKPTKPNTLREAAEETEAQLCPASITEAMVRPTEELQYELRVHQIELEMQNEELQRINAALEESHDRYVDLYNFAPVGYLTLTQRGLIDEINLTAAALLGIDRKKLLSLRFATLVTPKDGDKWYLFFINVMKRNKRLSIGLTLKGCNNTEIPVQMDCLCINSMLRITFTDIQQTDEQIKAGALQSAIFNSANFSSIATDAKGVIQIFNVGAERMLGYMAAEVMNKITPADISDPQEVIARSTVLTAEFDTPITPGFEALVFKASRGIEDIYELTYIRKDGSRFPAVVSVTALRDDKDTIIGYLLIGTDNTARKQIEEQLRWTEKSFRLMVESVTDYSIVMLDPNGRIVSWNSGAQRIKGYSAEEIIGQHFSQFYLPEDIRCGKAQRNLDVASATGRSEDEGWRVRKDGSMFWVNVSLTAIRGPDGNLRGYAKLTRDLTERNCLDQILLDKNTELVNAKLLAEKANLAKSNFLSNMSHELRTPLNAILGFAQLLEAGSPTPTAIQITRLHEILNAGWYLLELINEILDLAVIESGQLSFSREPVSLFDVMLECQAMIESQAQQHNIKLNFVPVDNTWFAFVDRTRVKQVLINLLSNAIKYNRKHGSVEVRCTESSSERLRISIKDSGVGLSTEKLAQLFQPFNRLGQEHGAEEGTGIGLVVTKQLVELMGGTIGVESIVGVGSEFWVELIRNDTSRLATRNTLSVDNAFLVSKNTALCTLLYVEDNPANLMLVEQIVEEYPHIRMLSACDGKTGIASALTHFPDVILMDINLPGITGVQALKILRKDPLTAHIPIIALSANAMPHDIEKGLEEGFFRYLTKPIKINEFMSSLEDALKFAEM